MTTQPSDTMERRVGRLEGAYEQVNERLDSLDRRLDSLDRRLESFRAEMNQRLNVHLVLIGGMWATMIGGFVALFLRL